MSFLTRRAWRKTVNCFRLPALLPAPELHASDTQAPAIADELVAVPVDRWGGLDSPAWKRRRPNLQINFINWGTP